MLRRLVQMLVSVVLPASAQWSLAPLLRPEILAEIPHDTAAFTQGLLWLDGKLYESTGLYGQSTLRQLNPNSGAVLKTRALDAKYFAEGLTHFQGDLIQLTWKEDVAFRYPLKGWAHPSVLKYSGEGWGLTALGQSMWMSNGSDTLYRRNGAFRITAKVPVKLGEHPLPRLNELEGVSGKIVANVWYCDSLFIIEPHSGRVLAVVDGSELAARSRRKTRDEVLNGIAYDTRKKQFLLTGKNWPVMFRVRIPYAF